MKKILIILTLTVISKLAISQCIPCTRHSQTDPANPVPGTDPCTTISTPPYATNEFDWMQLRNSPFHLTYTKPVTFANPLENPFYNSNTNGSIARGLISDFRPDQGWELIKKDLGYLHSGSPIILDPKPIIYIVLYNKFSGILRILADAPNQVGANLIQNVNVHVEFIISNPTNPLTGFDTNLDLGLTALLSGVQSDSLIKMQTLDQKTKVTGVTSRAVFPVSTTDFFYTDFQMAYDVCTCVLESGLKVTFEEVQSSTLTARGRLLATNTSINNTDPAQDFLSSVYEDPNSPNAEFFNQTYSSITNLKSDLNKASNVDANFLTTFKDGVDKTGKYIKLDKFDLSSMIPDLGNIPFVNSVMNFVVGESGLDKVSTAIDFFSSLFGDAPSNGISVDPQPTIIQGSISLTGKITSSKFQDSYQFYLSNPGSKYSEDRPEYYFINSPYNKPPYTTYNEVLGTFAVLKKPSRVELNNVSLSYHEYTYGNSNMNGYFFSQGHLLTAIPDPIMYTYNQALNIVKGHTIISAALVVELERPGFVNIDPYNLTRVSQVYNNVTLNYNEQYITPYVPIECLKNMVPYLNYYGDASKIALYHLNPGDFLVDNNNNFILNSVYIPKITKVYLKIIFIPEFQNINTNLPNKHSSQLFTYNIDLTPYTSTQPDLSTGYIETKINQDLTIPATTYTSDALIYAQGTIEITGNLSTSGVKVTIKAGNSITVDPGVIISPDITLEIGNVIECNLPINPQLDGIWLTNYCGKTRTDGINYHSNEIAGKTGWFHQESNPIQKLREEYGITFNPYPNPSKNTCAIDFTLKKDETVTISIFDVTGKSIYKILDNSNYTQGHFTVPVNMDLLDNGIYFCTFTTNDGYTETKKIVVAK